MKPPAPHTRAFVTTRQTSTATIRTRPRENDDVAPRGVPQIDSTFPPSRYCADGAAPSPGPVQRGPVSAAGRAGCARRGRSRRAHRRTGGRDDPHRRPPCGLRPAAQPPVCSHAPRSRDDRRPEPDRARRTRRAPARSGAVEAPRRRLSHPPRAVDVLLIVEIADSSMADDRDVKLPLYARASIPEVWLVDLPADRIEVYRAPTAGTYTDTGSASRGDTLTPLHFPNLRISTGDILG